MASLRQAADTAPAHWIEAGAGDFGAGVRALLPAGFEAYARILHPAESPEGEPVRWETVAGWAGATIHPRVQFKAFGRPDATAPWDTEPDVGELAPPLLQALTEVLAEQTKTAERCWFCLWDGYGWIDGQGVAIITVGGPNPGVQPAPVPEERLLDGPRVRLPHRDHLLFEGPLQAASELGDRGPDYFFPQSPNLFWPQDRAWCVATEIDLDSTYVGGSQGLVDALLADPRLEVLRADLNDPIDENSDQVNRRRR